MLMVVQISLEPQLVNWCFFVTGELVYHVRRAEITVISNGSISSLIPRHKIYCQLFINICFSDFVEV
jgi:hypothetical protein